MAKLVIVNELNDKQFDRLYKESKGFNPKINPNHDSYEPGESPGSYLLEGAKSLTRTHPGISGKLV